MKKHKVKIPEGYQLLSQSKTKNKTDSSEIIDINITFIKPMPIKKELHKTWEEYCTLNKRYSVGITMAIDDQEPYAGAFIALFKLIRLRDHYNDGWEPDMSNAKQIKYCIGVGYDKIIKEEIMAYQQVLSFKTSELRDEFLSNFAQLIEIAKPLL